MKCLDPPNFKIYWHEILWKLSTLTIFFNNFKNSSLIFEIAPKNSQPSQIFSQLSCEYQNKTHKIGQVN